MPDLIRRPGHADGGPSSEPGIQVVQRAPKDALARSAQMDDAPASRPPHAAAPTASHFAILDEIALRDGAYGVVHVTLSRDAFVPLGRHLARRAQQIGRRALVTAAPHAADPWLELARRFAADSSDPGDVAAHIAGAATGAVLVVADDEDTLLGQATLWGEALRDELCRAASDPAHELLLVVLTDRREGRAQAVYLPPALPSHDEPPPSADGNGPLLEQLAIDEIDAADAHRWWSAVVHQPSFADDPRFRRLDAVDRWWEASQRQPVERLAVSLPEAAARLRDYAAHARQALTREQVAALVPDADEATRALIAAGLADVDPQGKLRALDVSAARPLDAEGVAALAAALAAAPDGAWTSMRAAELWIESGRDAARAEALAFEALAALSDARAREDLWRRWDAVLAALSQASAAAAAPHDGHLERLVRAAEHALGLGDHDRADRMARQAMGIDGDRFDVLLLHGRSSHARGDATTAALSLTRAIGAAAQPGERARACAMMAQVRFMAGDPKQAERYALEAVEGASDTVTRLEGRNVLGKLLLSKEAWSDAEQHFACDAYDAARESLRSEELRARLNRAIAILYLGRREQAREMLEEVMMDGERYGIHRAVAYTLANLATIAILQHQYERALALSEQAIEVCRRFEPRVGLVQPTTNLAELRLRLGLVEEAEHSVRFGLQACGNNLPLSRYAFFAKVMSCIHLERGETARAAKEVATAISGATCSGDLSVVAQCHRISARIALEDGDLARARAAIDAAHRLRHTPFGQAELAVLETRAARAAGAPFIDAARKALTLAQQADDPETLRDAHVLLFHAYRADGDDASAHSHLRAAIEQRNRVADSLRPTLRQRFMARRALAELDELELDFAGASSGPSTVRSAPPDAALDADSAWYDDDRRRSADQSRKLVGDSPEMRALRGMIKRVAGTHATVLVTGPTGAGKELVAEAIHRASDRAHGPLVTVNCAALVETLLLSELFGHEKGAFTGASSRRRGRFEIAEGGTLFLDEIGDISPRTQVALLRVLQDGTFQRVGGCTTLRANVRVVCATHRDLKAMVERGEFREDLYYRLCGVVLEVPSLKERIADLPQLCATLLDRAHTQRGGALGGVERRPLSAEALRGLARHAWPGNVRELENAIRVAALFARGPQIELRDFCDNVESLRYLAELEPLAAAGESRRVGSIPPPSRDGASAQAPAAGTRAPDSDFELPPPSSSTDLVYAEIRTGTTLASLKRRLEQDCIARALVESGGNITRAAKLLGMKRPRLSQLVKQYKLASVLEDIKS